MRHLQMTIIRGFRPGKNAARQLLCLSAAFCITALSTNLRCAEAELFVPHVVDGGDSLGGRVTRLQTHIDVLNLGVESVQVEVELTTDDGQPFNAFLESSIHGGFTNRRTQTLRPGELGRFFTSPFGSILSGWARIEASGPVGVQVNLSRQVSPPGEVVPNTVSRVSYSPRQPGTHFRTFQEFDFGAGENDVGLAILNPSATEQAEVRIALIDLIGEEEIETTLAIPPGHKVARFLKSDLFAGNGLGLFSSVSVTSTIPVSALPISVDGDSWTAGPLLTSPTDPNGAVR